MVCVSKGSYVSSQEPAAASSLAGTDAALSVSMASRAEMSLITNTALGYGFTDPISSVRRRRQCSFWKAHIVRSRSYFGLHGLRLPPANARPPSCLVPHHGPPTSPPSPSSHTLILLLTAPLHPSCPRIGSARYPPRSRRRPCGPKAGRRARDRPRHQRYRAPDEPRYRAAPRGDRKKSGGRAGDYWDRGGKGKDWA